jgi:hypothetical protein
MAKTHKKGGKRKVARRVKTSRKSRSHKRPTRKTVKHSQPISKSAKDDTTHKSNIIISNLEKKKKGTLTNINYRNFSQGVTFNVH